MRADGTSLIIPNYCYALQTIILSGELAPLFVMNLKQCRPDCNTVLTLAELCVVIHE